MSLRRFPLTRSICRRCSHVIVLAVVLFGFTYQAGLTSDGAAGDALIESQDSRHACPEVYLELRHRATAEASSSSYGLSLAVYRRAVAHALALLRAGDSTVHDCQLPGIDDQLSLAVWGQARRLLPLQDACQARRHLPAKQNVFSLVLFAPSINIGYCQNYKTGTTTWLDHLQRWAGLPVSQDDYDIHLDTWQQLTPFKNNQTLGYQFIHTRQPLMFLSTRHPYERLTSFYRDKILSNDFYFRNLIKHCYVEAHNKSLSEMFTDKKEYDVSHVTIDRVVSFPELVRYVLKSFLLCKDHQQCRGHGENHLLPLYYNCAPCRIEYDVVTRVSSVG